MKRILAFLVMLASVFSLVSCRTGDKPDNDSGTNDKPDNGNNGNGTDNENNDGAGDGTEMPALTGERIEVSFSDNGYAIGQVISAQAKIHIPENRFFSNAEKYEVILVKGVYDALMYPDKDHEVLTTILKSDKDKYHEITDIGNTSYNVINLDINIPTNFLNEDSGKFTIALIGLKDNNDKSIISSGYTTYSYKTNGNQITIS